MTTQRNRQGPNGPLTLAGVVLFAFALVAILLNEAAAVAVLAVLALAAIAMAVFAPRMSGRQSIGVQGFLLNLDAQRQLAEDIASAESELRATSAAPVARAQTKGASFGPRLALAAQAADELKTLSADDHATVLDTLSRLESGGDEAVQGIWAGMWTSSDPPALYIMISPRPHLLITYRNVGRGDAGDPEEILVASIYVIDLSPPALRKAREEWDRLAHLGASAATPSDVEETATDPSA